MLREQHCSICNQQGHNRLTHGRGPDSAGQAGILAEGPLAEGVVVLENPDEIISLVDNGVETRLNGNPEVARETLTNFGDEEQENEQVEEVPKPPRPKGQFHPSFPAIQGDVMEQCINADGEIDLQALQDHWNDPENSYYVMDYETTGFLISEDAASLAGKKAPDTPLQVAVFEYRGGVEISRSVMLMNPGQHIKEKSFEVHGISDEDVAGERHYKEVVEEVAAKSQGGTLLVQNGSFDVTLMRSVLNNPDWTPKGGIVDMLPVARQIHKDMASRKLSVPRGPTGRAVNGLGAMAAHYGVDLTNAHDAGGDVEATAALYPKILSTGIAQTKVKIPAREQKQTYDEKMVEYQEKVASAPERWTVYRAERLIYAEQEAHKDNIMVNKVRKAEVEAYRERDSVILKTLDFS